jgi:hypothetical protein
MSTPVTAAAVPSAVDGFRVETRNGQQWIKSRVCVRSVVAPRCAARFGAARSGVLHLCLSQKGLSYVHDETDDIKMKPAEFERLGGRGQTRNWTKTCWMVRSTNKNVVKVSTILAAYEAVTVTAVSSPRCNDNVATTGNDAGNDAGGSGGSGGGDDPRDDQSDDESDDTSDDEDDDDDDDDDYTPRDADADGAGPSEPARKRRSSDDHDASDPRRQRVLLIELFCGTARVSHLALKTGVADDVVAFDINRAANGAVEHSGVSASRHHTVDVVDNPDAVTAAIAEAVKANTVDGVRPQVMMFASPCCKTFSSANTVLKAKSAEHREAVWADADRSVAEVWRIADRFDAALVLMENPAGSSLWKRAVVTERVPLRAQVEGRQRVTVDYCQFGDLRQKPTCVLATADLHPYLPPPASMRCPGAHACPYHVVPTQGMHNQAWKSAIPGQFVVRLLDAARRFLAALPPPAVKKARHVLGTVSDDVRAALNDPDVLAELLRVARDAAAV